MELHGAGVRSNLSDIVRPHTAAGHYYHAAGRPADELGDERASKRCTALVARCQKPVASEGKDVAEGPVRVPADVESPVESDRQRPGTGYQTAHHLHIHVALRSEGAYHDASCTETLAHIDAVQHPGYLLGIEHEIPASRTDKDIDRKGIHCAYDGGGKALGRGDPADGKVLAEFDSPGAAVACAESGLKGGAARFYQHRAKISIFLYLSPIMKKTLTLLLLVPFLAAAQPERYSDLYSGLPLDIARPALPEIPDARVSIADFGAVPDGVSLCTGAFERAIGELAASGGGHVDVPAGVWLTGHIELRSGIDLHLCEGALVVFTPDKSAYAGDGSGRCLPLVSAVKCTDISITGSGVLDGSGKYWRYVKRTKVSETEWKDYLALGGKVSEDGSLWYPYDLKNLPNRTAAPKSEDALRPHMLALKRCKRVLVSGVTVQNSPRFHIVPSVCEDVVIDGVTVRCPWNAQNGDGIDIGNSRRVLVTRCRLDVGDDGICMKGGSGEAGLRNGPCSDILICGNTVFRAHGGFVIGSDISGGMQRIIVRDCTFSGTDIGLRFKSSLGRGGRTSDIVISDIRMNDIREDAVSFLCDYTDTGRDPYEKGSSFAPEFRDITISGVVCRGCRSGIRASGLTGRDCVSGITVRDCVFFHEGRPTDIDAATASVSVENCRFETW